jgi:drug/metabolite transporter (DMT)-like permease
VPVLGLSLVAAVIAYVAGIGAARRLGAKLASFIGMTEVLFAILFAWLALGQLPTPIQFLGGAFILVGIALVRAGEQAPVPANPDEAEVEAAGEDPVCEAAQHEPSGPHAHSPG